MSNPWYPAGAASDPRAPFNQRDADFPCRCGHEMDDHDAVTFEDAQPCTVEGCDCDNYREDEGPGADDLRDMEADSRE